MRLVDQPCRVRACVEERPEPSVPRLVQSTGRAGRAGGETEPIQRTDSHTRTRTQSATRTVSTCTVHTLQIHRSTVLAVSLTMARIPEHVSQGLRPGWFLSIPASELMERPGPGEERKGNGGYMYL